MLQENGVGGAGQNVWGRWQQIVGRFTQNNEVCFYI